MPYVTIRGKQMFYEDHGAGFPILFLHSYLWDAAMWVPQVAALSATYRCIVPELWGHGRSDVLPSMPTSLDELTEDYWALTQALGIERFAVVGLSVGGMIAVHLAVKHSEAVAALVVMDSHVGAEPTASQARFFQMLDAVERFGSIVPPIAEATVPFFFADVTLARRPEMVEAFKTHLVTMSRDVIPTIVALGRAIFGRASILERLPELRIPTLFVAGEQDRSRPPHEAEEMARLVPNAKVTIIREAGHICTQEQPEQVTQVLTEFLNVALG